jgi:hypothetical protein
VLTLILFLVATVVGPAPSPPFCLVPREFATLTDREARQLAGRRTLYCVVLEGKPD